MSKFEIICESSSNVDVPTYIITNNLDSFEIYEDKEKSQKLCDLLNEQDMHIFLLKCVIQTITAESMDKNISHKRIMEIKKHWYDKLQGDVE